MNFQPKLTLRMTLAAMLGVTVTGIALILLTQTAPAVAAPCCQSCEADYMACLSSCNSQCGTDPSCLNACLDQCDTQYNSCARWCIFCHGGGGDESWDQCCQTFTGYCPPECAACVSCL
jgi:hypothetical protein